MSNLNQDLELLGQAIAGLEAGQAQRRKYAALMICESALAALAQDPAAPWGPDLLALLDLVVEEASRGESQTRMTEHAPRPETHPAGGVINTNIGDLLEAIGRKKSDLAGQASPRDRSSKPQG